MTASASLPSAASSDPFFQLNEVLRGMPSAHCRHQRLWPEGLSDLVVRALQTDGVRARGMMRAYGADHEPLPSLASRGRAASDASDSSDVSDATSLDLDEDDESVVSDNASDVSASDVSEGSLTDSLTDDEDEDVDDVSDGTASDYSDYSGDEYSDYSGDEEEDAVSGDEAQTVHRAAQMGLDPTDMAFWLVADGFKVLGAQPDGHTKYEIKAGFGKPADRKVSTFHVYAKSDREALIWLQAVSLSHEFQTLTKEQFKGKIADLKTRGVTLTLALAPVADQEGTRALWLYHKDDHGACVRYVQVKEGSGETIHPVLTQLAAMNLNRLAERARRDYEEKLRARQRAEREEARAEESEDGYDTDASEDGYSSDGSAGSYTSDGSRSDSSHASGSRRSSISSVLSEASED